MGETATPQTFLSTIVPNKQAGTCFGSARPLGLAQTPHPEVTSAAAQLGAATSGRKNGANGPGAASPIA